MKQHVHTRPALRIPLTAAALSLILAACGGGGDGDSAAPQAISSSPSAPRNITATANGNTTGTHNADNVASAALGTTTANTRGVSNTTIANVIAEGASQAPVTSNDGNQSHPAPSSANNNDTSTAHAANTADDTNADSATSSAASNETNNINGDSTAPLVSAQGVRGDVLLAMFDQQACRDSFDVGRADSLSAPNFYSLPDRTSDTPPVLADTGINRDAYSYDMSKWEQDGRRAPARAPTYVYQCSYDDIRSYSNPMQPGSYAYTMITAGQYHTYLTSRYYGDPTITKGVNKALVEYPLMVTQNQFSIGSQAKVELKEDFGYKAKDISGQGIPEGRRIEAVLSGTARTYERQGLVPFGAVNQWKDSTGNDVELLLIKADEPDTVRICTHINSTLAKRLHCVTWKVPADWTWGKELIGGKHYLIDDRTVYAGETGLMYWH